MGGDTKLKEHVESELRWQPNINEAAIGVGVQDAVVTLTGFVPSYLEKIAAERAVLRIRGVKALASELQVSMPGSRELKDEEIAHNALSVITWNAAIPKNMVKVKVGHGIVTLSGSVDWPFQKHDAEREVSHLAGVKGLVNMIEVKPVQTVASTEIKAGIDAALKRSAELEAKRIHVETQGSKVVLTGTLASWPERNAAERAAWAGPGVTSVENKILINASMAAGV